MNASVPSRPSAVEPREPNDPKGPRRAKADPLAAIFSLGSRQRRFGAILAIAGTLVVHGAPATQAVRSLADMREFSKHVLDTVRQRLQAEIDLDTEKPPPPPPPPPPPEPEPPPPAREAAPPKEAPPPPPSPAQAGKVLTQEADPDEPVDLTGEGFVTGNADRYVGGVTSNEGKSTQPVRKAATNDGVANGVGTTKAPPPPPAQDLSRPAAPVSGGGWKDCGFPSEADVENVNQAVVTLVVTVDPDGRAKSVNVVSESPSGLGFGKQARTCALRKPFQAGLDVAGKPATRSTAPFNVRFVR
jgi:protein TonB